MRTTELPSGTRRDGLRFEDLRVGQRLEGPTDAVVGVQSSGLDLALRLLGEGELAEPLRLRAVNWRFVAPLDDGRVVHPQLTVTRCRPGAAPDEGIVHGHLRLLGEDGDTLRDGGVVLQVPARGDGSGYASAHTDFCSAPWGEALVGELAATPAFAEATGAFDGSIGLRCGCEAVQLRIYRGAVLEVARSTPQGPTFTLWGSELAWLELVRADRNDFVVRASRGEFDVFGNAFEYLRMIKGIVAIWDAARRLAAQADA